ncbi:MAG: tetratricopeptide repeat-containing sensor histidine kinase [Ignavibacteria bacterium]|nr:tetratricopeptide repeat-containing sensor histidine kinase [Ignavibacteria bacterium]
MSEVMKVITIIIVSVLLSVGSYGANTLLAQTREADSLKQILAKELRAKPSTHDTALVNRMIEIGFSLRNTFPDTALIYANEALLRAKKIGYKSGQARSLGIRGIVAIYERHYNAGLEALLESYDIYEVLGEKVRQAFVLNNLGYMHKAQGKMALAKDYFKRSEAIFRTANHKAGLALVMGNLGDIALKSGDIPEALRLEREAFEWGKLGKEDYYAHVALYHIGTVFLALEKYDSAAYYQKEALQFFERKKINQYIIRSLENLAAIYASEKRFPLAFATAERGLRVADSTKAFEDIALMCERFSMMYSQVGRHDSALGYYRRAAAMRDSLLSFNIEERMKTLDIMRLAERKDKVLLLAEKEQERLGTLRNTLILGLVFVMILLALAVNRYRFKARSEAALREVNAVILRQQRELEEQSKHIQESNTALATSNMELDIKNEHLYEANQRLEAANQRLEALNHEKDELLSIVAHDLKNPLTAIMMSSSTLVQAANLPLERIVAMGERILQSSERMLNTITKLLSLNALEQGGKTLETRRFNVARLVRDLVEEHHAHAASKDIMLLVEVSDENIELQTDESAMAEVVENLLDNALKYSPKGKRVWVSVQKNISADAGNRTFARIAVRDEGPGLSDDDKIRMFGKFARLSAKPTGGEDSTGLGLSIVKKLVDAMGAEIMVESQYGQGTTFNVDVLIEVE